MATDFTFGVRVVAVTATLLLVVPAVAAASLSDAERRGKRVYIEGKGRAPLTAHLTGPNLEVPATAVPCIGCHMAGGTGQREGGVQSADISYATLSKAFRGIRPSGRAHPPYDDEGLMMAILAGKDPAGNVLHEAHPRYQMEEGDLADLVAYLKVLGHEPVPGITDTEIRIGMLLPTRGPLAEAGEEVRALIASYFAEVNARGGLFRRSLTLVPIPFDPERPGDAAEATSRAVGREEIFCFLANVGVSPEDEAAKVLSSKQVPVIAPLLVAPVGGYGTDPYTFHIYASLRDQGRVMVDFLAEGGPTPVSRVALLYAEDPSGRGGAAGAREQLQAYPLSLVEEASFAPGRLAAPAVVARLKNAEADAVLFFGGSADAAAFLTEAGRQRWRPRLLAPATMVGPSVLSLVPEFAGSVYLATPLATPDPASEEMEQFFRLREKSDGPGTHHSFQLLAYAGARLLAEGLKRSGREVTRDRLVEALGGLWAFPMGVTPPLSFDDNRRVGAIGAAILKADAVAQRLIPAAPWREPREATARSPK